MTDPVVIREIEYKEEAVKAFEESLKVEVNSSDPKVAREARVLLDYPTVYVVHQQDDKGAYSVYVGETTDIRIRTMQHLRADVLKSDDWKVLSEDPSTQMFVIGHPMFNKSLTLDIENRLMQWLPSSPLVKTVVNQRENAQNLYFTRERLDELFLRVWRKLRRLRMDLFPTQTEIEKSALFKASPFHKLTQEQIEAKALITEAIYRALDDAEALCDADRGKLIMVRGAAGAGKTVLLSNLFLELSTDSREAHPTHRKPSVYLLVNHDEQVDVYRQMAQKLHLHTTKSKVVTKPTSFINSHGEQEKVDVVLVDEAHLLWTQGKQSYQGKNHLEDLLKRARVVIAVFDPNQAVATNQVWDEAAKAWLDEATTETIELSQQMRMQCSDGTAA